MSNVNRNNKFVPTLKTTLNPYYITHLKLVNEFKILNANQFCQASAKMPQTFRFVDKISYFHSFSLNIDLLLRL
jgi:hypothetical protein